MVTGFRKNLRGLIKYFIPSDHHDNEQLYRESSIRVSLMLITAFLYLLYTPNAYTFDGIKGVSINMVTIVLVTIVLFLYKDGMSVFWSANLYLFGAALAIFAGVFYQGGLLMISGIVLVPAIAMLVGGKKVATIWLFITLAFLSVVYYLDKSGFSFETPYEASLQPYVIYSGVFGIVIALFFSLMVFENEKERALKTVLDSNESLNNEKQKSDNLLLNILPAKVAQELKDTGNTKAQYYQNVTILFTDFINFTGISEILSPSSLVTELHKAFTAFDEIIEQHGLEKIKTTGDSYLAVAGMYDDTSEHAIKAIAAAKDIIKLLQEGDIKFQVRVGLHTGSIVGGVVGTKKYVFDIWGDAVNIAARMEQNSEAGKINISESTHQLVNQKYNCTFRGKIEAKNKGMINMYFVE